MKQKIIAEYFKNIMLELGLDLNDDSLIDTPERVAKMYVNELFWGLNTDNFPKIKTQDNKFNYDQMLIESNISVKSTCEHHFIPFVGYAHIGYIPKNKIIGLSKFNRVVEYFSRRPQVQERLTNDVLDFLKNVLDTNNIAVVVDACHFCVRLRGIQHEKSITRTSALAGAFIGDKSARLEFFNSIPNIKDFKL